MSTSAKKQPTEKRSISAKLMMFFTAVILFVLSFLSINLFGKNCSLEFNVQYPDQVRIEYDQNIVECIGQHTAGNKLTLDFRSVSKGDTFVVVRETENMASEVHLYVHASGIITLHNYFGQCRGDIMFSVTADLLLLMLFLILLKKYRIKTKETLCRYSNAWLLGILIFVGFTLLQQMLTLILLRINGGNPSGLDVFEQTILSARTFALMLLPFTLLISLAISISNLILMKHEGIGLRNMLGFFLGIVLCAGTIAPETIYPLLDSLGVNVHKYDSPVVLTINCAENIISVIMTYFECILFGTAVSAVRAAKHIPAFDKDYILIHGCQIQKDGSLTKLLQSRADRAIEFADMQKQKTGRDIVFVPSGGKGSDEVISEAEAIGNYLVSAGIPEEQILLENKSKNTDENIRFSYDLIRARNENANIAFSTTNYHVFRTGCMADEAGIRMEGIGAKTKRYFWINAFIREFIATLHYEKRSHIKALLWVLLCVIPAEIIVYLSYLY